METLKRRSFFAALAAPLLAPLRKLLPAAPENSAVKAPMHCWLGVDPASGPDWTTVVTYYASEIKASTKEFCTSKRVYTFVGNRLVHVHEYGYWHGRLPFAFYDTSKITVSVGKDTSA